MSSFEFVSVFLFVKRVVYSCLLINPKHLNQKYSKVSKRNVLLVDKLNLGDVISCRSIYSCCVTT